MTPESLVAAVRERLDETERLARAATCEAWTVRVDCFGEVEVVTDAAHARYVGDKQPEPYDVVSHGDFHEAVSLADAEHIAFHDPAAVLRRVAAQRRVLERHQPHIGDDGQATCEYCPADYEDELTPWPCPDFADLADGLGIDLEETS